MSTEKHIRIGLGGNVAQHGRGMLTVA